MQYVNHENKTWKQGLACSELVNIEMTYCASLQTRTHTTWTESLWDIMKVAPKLGTDSYETTVARNKAHAWHESLQLEASCWNVFLFLEEHYINTLGIGGTEMDTPFHPNFAFYHFPRLFTTNTRATLPELIMDSQAATYCQVLPHSLGLAWSSWQPSIQEHGGESLVVCWCWLWCVGGMQGGVVWCHSVAWRGPIKPWENYVTFCWAGPFKAIEVQWIESCREVIFPLSCVCVWEKAGEEKKTGGEGGWIGVVGVAGESIVDMLMLLTISKAIKMSWSSTSKNHQCRGLHTPLFLFRRWWPSSPTNLVLNMIPMMLSTTCQNTVKRQNKSPSTQQRSLTPVRFVLS